MPEMKTWTVGETTYEIVDAKAREAINEINTARENGEFKGDKGETGPQGPKGDKGERGYGIGVSVKEYGAAGDGSAGDTASFQTALAANRVVFVPGGTYMLSDTLVIRENCCLELSQDTILQFTQNSGNCIEMRGSATLQGNHAIISVPYEFTGNVVSLDTSLDGNVHNSIPPYSKADPMFKRQRFVYDVNIIKPTADGFHRTTDGTCNGTAIYMHAYNAPNDSTDIPWMWAITMSGIRIAGGFSYGIRAKNIDDPNSYTDNAWNHDMRIEAVIEACEVGVALENCNGAHLQVTVQPCQAVDKTVYAKWGVYLNDSRFVDMIGSRIWDWNANNSLWTSGGEYQHLALIGNCSGLLLDDFIVHETSADIRSLIYTDTASNFDTMTILQEPANKWFKSIENVPYFNDGTKNRKLMLASEKITAEQVEFITPADGYYTYEPNFTNLAVNNTDGVYLVSDGTTMPIADNYTTTDFIAIDPSVMHTYRIGGEGIVWKDNYGYGRIVWYDADKNVIGQGMSWDKVGTNEYYPAWVEDDTVESAFITLTTQAAPSKAYYFRITARGKGENLIVTIDEKQDYNAIWHGEPKRLDDSIKVKAENVVGGSSGGADWNAAEGEPGHVQNRTHYKEIVTIVEETTISDDIDAPNYPVLDVISPILCGETYTVRWGNEVYECKTLFVYSDESGEYLGRGNFGGAGVEGYEDTGEPFFLSVSEGGMYCDVTVLETVENIPVSIQGPVYTPLNKRYMPVTHYVVTIDSVYSNGDTDSTTTALAYPNFDATDLCYALANGLPVYLDITALRNTQRRLLVTDWAYSDASGESVSVNEYNDNRDKIVWLYADEHNIGWPKNKKWCVGVNANA